MKRVYYYYIPEVGKVQELIFDYPLTKAELIVSGYRFLKSGKVDRYPWE